MLPLKQIEIDLVDLQLINVARGVLLDHLAVILDVLHNEEDALFLWGVAYCLALPPAWLLRLQNLLVELLNAPTEESGIASRLPKGEDEAAVRRVFQAWADPTAGKLTATKAQKDRSQHLATWLTRNQRASLPELGKREPVDPQWEKYLEGQAVFIASAAECSELDKECKAYYHSGTSYPSALDDFVKVPESEWLANPTLLDPDTRTWHLHYGSCPFLSFLPLDGTVSETTKKAAKRGDRKALVSACFADFKALVSGRRRAEGATTMQFWVGDALQFCSSGVELHHGAYSSIETSNLADNLGLLTLLVLCRPLLRAHPRAALHTSSMKWPASGTKRLSQYLEKSLGIDLRLAPILLGVRLLSQPELGREMPRSRVSAFISDTFIWQPAPTTQEGSGPAPMQLPRLVDHAELLNGIKALAKACTVHAKQGEGNSLTLLHLLRGLSERVIGVLPPRSGAAGSSAGSGAGPLEWRRVAEHTAKLCALSSKYKQQWQSLCCWCFGALGGWENSPNSVPAKDVPLLARWKIKPSEVLKRVLAERGSHTPSIACIAIITKKQTEERMDKLMEIVTSGASMDAFEKDVICKYTLDVVGFNSDTFEATCLLTPDDDREMTMLVVMDSSQGRGDRMVALCEGPEFWENSDARRVCFSRPPPPRLAGAAWVAAETASSASASTLPPALDLIALGRSSIWPGDGDVLGKIKVEGLPSAPLKTVGDHMGSMFTLEEAMSRVGRSGVSSRPSGVLFDLKESIQAIFVVTKQQGDKLVHSLLDTADRDASEAAITLAVHKIVKLPDGRPLAHVSYVDHALAKSMYRTPQEVMHSVQNFGRIMKSPEIQGTGVSNTVKCAPGEVPMFKEILARNAQRLVVPAWQKKLLRGSPEWQASFLLPLYTDQVDDIQGIMDTMSDLGDRPFKAGSTDCAVCGKSDSKRCSRCMKVFFCSTECQKKAWPQHKKVCKPPVV